MPIPPGRDTNACRPRRPGLLCNPKSGRFAHRLEGLRTAARGFAGGLCREGCDPAEIGGAVRDLVTEGADIIIVLGGDGTLQAVLDSLPGVAGTSLPPLVVVPCGTTNMTALDVGCRQAPLRVLERLRRRMQENQAVPLVTRPVLRVARKRLPPLHGMFFGMGMITTGVRYFRERVRGAGLTGEAAAGLAVLRMLFRLLSGMDGAGSRSVRARVSGNEGPVEDGSFLLLFASTLERLLLGTRPYWGREEAPMHVTAIREGSRALWRSLPRVLRGHAHGLDERDYQSRNLRVLDLECSDDFVLDGEIHEIGPESGGLRIDTGGPVYFAVP